MLNPAENKIFLPIKVKMPTIVGILKFISMINLTFERLKQEQILFVGIYFFKEQLKFCSQLS